MRAVRCLLFAAALVASGIVPAASLAQADGLPAPRQVNVRVTSAGVRAPDSLAAGRYRMEIHGPRRGPSLLLLVKPDRGYTRADLRADDRRGGAAANRRIRTNLRFFGGAEMRAGGSGTLWETLYAGRYWLVGFTERARGLSMKTVHVHGTPSASSFPRVAAETTNTDAGLQLTPSIPRAGRMLVRNTSPRLDFVFFLPLQEGATYADFLRSLRHPRRVDSPVRFRGIKTTTPLSPNAGYVLRYRLRPGNYVALGIRGIGAFDGRHRENLRRVIRPLTVRSATQASSRPRSMIASTEGFATAPTHGTGDSPWPTWATR